MRTTGPAGTIPPCERCGAAHGAAEGCTGPATTLAFEGERVVAAPEPGHLVDPLVGSQVGSFRIVRLLGRGGMGTVYLGEHPVIGSRVAIKFLHEWLASDPALVARFYDEARAVNLVGHENIVGIFDLCALPPDRYYFVMEYLDGETLQQLMHRGPVDPAVAEDVLLQICEALQCAHEHGVVHRDMKPENVFLVARRGRSHFVKILDFGIAKLRGGGRKSESGLGRIVGTPEYIAPEQCEERAIDARTDVYSVGVMAYELATGRLPFEAGSVPQLLLAHMTERPRPPSELAPITPALERAILRALEKTPDARFPDMASFAAALRGSSEAGRTRAPPAAPTPSAPAPAAALHAEVRDGPAAGRFAVSELTRGGLLLRAEGAPPPLRSRLRLALLHQSLRAPLEVAGEVVRHLGPAEASAWRTASGFAVQFVDPTPEARAAIAAIADEVRRDVPTPAAPASAEAADARLRSLEARSGGTHYAFLGIPPDAEFADVRRALRTIQGEMEALRARPLALDQAGRATALLARALAAQEALGTAAARLVHDARIGNHAGVARCLAAGVPAALVEARRRELLATSPERAREAERQLARARVARKLGNLAAARAALEAALEADPLDPAARDALRAADGPERP